MVLALRVLMVLAPVVGLALLAAGFARMRAFERRHARIDSAEALAALRALGARQVLAAVAAVPLFVVPFACMQTLKSLHAATGLDATLGSMFAAVCFFVGLVLRAPERRLWALPCADDLRAERDRVVRAWRTRHRPGAVRQA